MPYRDSMTSKIKTLCQEHVPVIVKTFAAGNGIVAGVLEYEKGT